MKNIYRLMVIAGLLVAGSVSAHVVVKPSAVIPGAFQTFSMGVPVEKTIATKAVTLKVPEGLLYVTPNVKPGWKIGVTKVGDAVTEITWTGGTIPAGQRDEFFFAAKVPSESTTLNWKAYQTYQDGTVVAWDKAAGEEGEPFSVTMVASTTDATEHEVAGSTVASSTSLTFSLIALVFSIVALGVARRNKNTA